MTQTHSIIMVSTTILLVIICGAFFFKMMKTDNEKKANRFTVAMIFCGVLAGGMMIGNIILLSMPYCQNCDRFSTRTNCEICNSVLIDKTEDDTHFCDCCD